jgi:hypothetical protein
MSHGKLAEIVVRTIEYFELVDDAQLDPDTAVQHLESISADLAGASSEEQAAVKNAAKARLAWFDRERGEHEYAPRLASNHRRLLEGIASGEAWGQSGSAT